MAYKHLISSLQGFLADPTQAGVQKDIRSSMKALEYIFKFIIQSRVLQRNQEKKGALAGKSEEVFREQLLTLFQGFNKMMAQTSPPALIGAQILALQNFALIFKELAKVFDTRDLVKIAASFIESVNNQNTTITVEKLKMIRGIVKSVLFENNDSRSVLAPVVLRQVQQHLNPQDKDTMKPCMSILSEILDTLQTTQDEGEGALSVTSMLPRLLDAYNNLTEQDPKDELSESPPPLFPLLYLLDVRYQPHVLAPTPAGISINRALIANSIAMVYVAPTSVFSRLLEAQKRSNNLRPFLERLMDNFIDVLRHPVFPRQWAQINQLTCRACLKLSTVVKAILDM